MCVCCAVHHVHHARCFGFLSWKESSDKNDKEKGSTRGNEGKMKGTQGNPIMLIFFLNGSQVRSRMTQAPLQRKLRSVRPGPVHRNSTKAKAFGKMPRYCMYLMYFVCFALHFHIEFAGVTIASCHKRLDVKECVPIN